MQYAASYHVRLQQPVWTAESYTSISPHLHSKASFIFIFTFGGVASPDCLYKRRACSQNA
jgi:hypothetical protein